MSAAGALGARVAPHEARLVAGHALERHELGGEVVAVH